MRRMGERPSGFSTRAAGSVPCGAGSTPVAIRLACVMRPLHWPAVRRLLSHFERLIRFFLFFLVLEFLIQLSCAVKEGCETIQHARRQEPPVSRSCKPRRAHPSRDGFLHPERE